MKKLTLCHKTHVIWHYHYHYLLDKLRYELVPKLFVSPYIQAYKSISGNDVQNPNQST